MVQHLVIFGGSGFIGQALCQKAVAQEIPVVSISRSGQPHSLQPLLTSPLITWVKADVLTEITWRDYLVNAYAAVNLIGIRHEQQGKKIFYADFIVKANKIIADALSYHPTITYLFLSANASGPFVSPDYLTSKRQAELYLQQHLANPTVIFRPGLVTGKGRPSSFINGLGIRLLAHLPLLRDSLLPVYPISLTDLAQQLLAESHSKENKIIRPKE